MTLKKKKEVKNEVKQHGHEDSEKNIENLEQRMKRTEKSRANGRQKKKSRANGRQSEPNRDKAKYEEKHSTKESCSHLVPDVQPGNYELKLGEVIPAINFNEETVEYETQTIQTAQKQRHRKSRRSWWTLVGLKQMYEGSQPSS